MTRLLTGLALVLALGLAACGGGDTESKNDYVAAVNKAQTEFADSVSKAPLGTTATDTKQVFANLKASIDKVVADLKAVEPPEEVTTEHDKFVSALERFGAAMQKAGESITSNDPQKIADAQQTLGEETSSVSAELGKAIGDINAKLQE